MVPSGASFPNLINPEAARLLELVRVPQQDQNFKRKIPGRSQVAVAKNTLPTRLPRPGFPRFFPGLAEALESHQPPEDPLKALQSLEDDSDDSELQELENKVMSATAPLPWRQLAELGSCSDQQWYTRRQVAPRVPALPKWLRQQIDRAMLTDAVRPSKSLKKAVVSTPKGENTTEGSNFDQGMRPEANTFPGQRRGGEMLFVEDGDGEEGLHERRRIRWKLLVKLRGPKRKLEDKPNDDLEDLEPDTSEEVGASMSAEDKRTAEEKGLQSLQGLPLGSVFRGGRLENAEKKRNQAFKEITLKSDKTARVQRLNHRRKQMYKGQDEEESSTESEVPRRSSKTSSVRRPPETADTAEGQLLLEAFRRYDREDEGELTMKDVRSCLADIGIHPSLPPEKRAMTEVLQSAQPQNGLDFYIISQLVPKIWEAIALAKRQDLEYWFSRSLDEHGFYDMQQLRPCLEALGLRIHDEEWMEVERIFMPVCRDKKPTKKTFTKSVTKILFEQKMRKVKGPEKSPVHASDLTDFEVFQKSFFTVQEHLTRRRRRLERQLCEEHQLTHEQIDEFRSDLVSLDFLFRRFDRHRRKKLTENEVLNLLVACGADSRLLRSDFMPSLVREGRFLGTVAVRGRGSLLEPKHSFTTPAAQSQSSGWKKLQKVARPRAAERTSTRFEVVGGPQGEELNFFEFLYLMKFMRQQSLEVQIDDVRAFFQRMDKDEYGNIQMKEAMRLFPELGLSPRSRVEQLEIKQILNEVDEGGTGTLSWDQFTQVVLLCQERLERLLRSDEEHFAVSLGFTVERCRELRKVFLDSKNDFNFMEISELRRAMTMMQRLYTSEELILLFTNFAHRGQMDFRCFIKMMHAVDILKNESHLWQDKRKVRSALTESLTSRF